MAATCEICPSAVKITIKKRVKEVIEKGHEVIIITVDNNGKTKEEAYKRCQRPPYDMNTCCYKHFEVKKKDKKSLKIYDKLKSLKTTRMATLSDRYLGNYHCVPAKSSSGLHIKKSKKIIDTLNDIISQYSKEKVVTPETKSDEKSDEKVDTKKGDESGDESGEESGDESGDESGEEPGEESGDESGEESGDESGEEPGDVSGEESGDVSGEESGEKSDDVSGEESGDESVVPETKDKIKSDDNLSIDELSEEDNEEEIVSATTEQDIKIKVDTDSSDDESLDNSDSNDESLDNSDSNDESDTESIEETLNTMKLLSTEEPKVIDNSENSEIEDSSDEEEDSGDESDGLACIEIYTKDGRRLYYHEGSNSIYSPEGDEEGSDIGKLLQVDTKKAPIYRAGNNYIVGKMIKIGKTDYMKCTLTNQVYISKKEKLILKGIAKKDSKGKYHIKKIK
jgi:hypothetical protein